MSTDWHGDALVDAIKRKAAEGLLAAAVFYENTLRQKVATPSPFFTTKKEKTFQAASLHLSIEQRIRRGMSVHMTTKNKRGETFHYFRVYYDPSKRGEYPKLRTGAGQKAITHQPRTVAEVVQTGSVKVGYVKGDHHLLTLEMEEERKGLIALLDELRPQLTALATAAFTDDR